MSQESILNSPLILRVPSGRSRQEILDDVENAYRLRRHSVYRAVLAVTRDPSTAEELTQEAFFRLYQFCVGGGTVENAVAWTTTVARHLAADHFRRKKIERDADSEFWSRFDETCSDVSESPEETHSRGEEADRLAALVDLLPPAHRDCVKLYGRGCSFREIAETLGLPYHQALNLTREGLARVKHLLDRADGRRPALE